MTADDKLLFLQPYFQNKIWGGTRLKTEYGYDIPSDHTGECWAISAHQNGPAVVMNGSYKGQTLTDVFAAHRELFGNQPRDRFPMPRPIFRFRFILMMSMLQFMSMNWVRRNADTYWQLSLAHR